MPKEVKRQKICFVIAPIGDEGSETRHRSDQVLKHIIEPTTEEFGYVAIRADKISEPGIITAQVIQHVVDDDLVIADLTDRNPNVFYELAVRHMVKKPIVQIIQTGEPIPFDVSTSRTINFDHRNLDSVANCKSELIKQIRAVEEDPMKVDSPISVAIDLKSLQQSERPLEKSNAEIIMMLQEIRSAISVMTMRTVDRPWAPTNMSRTYEDLLLDKFPDFDPNWPDVVKKAWIEDIKVLRQLYPHTSATKVSSHQMPRKESRRHSTQK